MIRLFAAMIMVAIFLAGCQTSTKQGSATSSLSQQTKSPQKQPEIVGTATIGKPDVDGAENVSEMAKLGVVDDSVEMEFLDTTSFDLGLSSELRKPNQEVVVAPLAKFTMNNIPDRMDRWLAEVERTGGKIQAQELSPDGGESRFVVGIIIDLVAGFSGAISDTIREKATYGPAKNYDALLKFDKDTGDVTEVIFSPREEVP